MLDKFDRREAPRREEDIERVARDELSAAVAKGVQDGFAAVMKDEELLRAFWKEGYLRLAESASSGASQWVGKRILTAAAFAGIGLLVAWLVKTGAIK